MEAAAAMDLNALSRRELQALCKLNGVRANMTNLAMVEALQSLPEVEGIDQIGTTLGLPTPAKSAMKSALRAAVGDEPRQQGSPLPRGRRVSVKSPEAVRMDGGEDDEVKRGLVREIVRTPGVALRSTSRRGPRATPAPTPAAGTLRRSQRSTARKSAAAPAEAEAATAKRSTRRTGKLNMVIDFDQEEEKVQEVEPKGVASDAKRDGPEEEEVTKLLEGNSEADEPEQGEEVDSSVASVGSADKGRDDSKVEEAVEEPTKLQEVVSSVASIESAEKSCDNSKVEEAVEEPTKLQEVVSSVALIESDEKSCDNSKVEEEATKPQEGAATGEQQKLINVEESVMEDSPIFGVLSKVAPEPAMKNVGNASAEDGEGFGSWSPVLEIADAINNASDDKEDAAVEVPKEAVKEDIIPTSEAADAPNNMTPAGVTEKEVSADEFPEYESDEAYDFSGESSDEAALTEENSEEDDLDDGDMQNTGLAVHGDSDEVDLTVESDVDSCEEDELDDDEDMQNAGLTVEGDSDETIEASNSTDVNFDSDEEEEELNMLETGEEMKEGGESDSLTEEEDDFSGDLSSEFDSTDFSDAETENKSSPMAFEGIHAAAPSSAAKSVESAITEEIVSSEGEEVFQNVETIVKSLDKVTITEEKKQDCAKEKKQLKVGEGMSLRKLKSAYKESLISAKEGKKLTINANEGTRMALAELDDNAEC